MAEVCQHLDAITEVKHAKARRCEECVKIGARWDYLRTCQSCGITQCCDSSPNQARDQARPRQRTPGRGVRRAGRALVVLLPG